MYKDIVVCVNEADGRDNTIRAAARLASELNANLTGLYIRVSDAVPSSLYGLVSYQIIDEAKKREDVRVTEAKASFEAIIDDVECDSSWLEVSESEHPMKVIAYHDLVITNQAAYDPRVGLSNIGFINNLVLGSGKPVILIPNEWDEPSFGANIVIGWDESRESVRAIQDAMPLLQKADRVEAVSVNYREKEPVVDISQISTYLTRRNVTNSFKLERTDERLDSSEKVLLKCAKRNSADLLVVGGYGHTRLREVVLGGVTRYLTKHSHIPVLFSH